MIPNITKVIKAYPEFAGIHPACLAVPMITDEMFSALVNDIERNGLLVPIVTTKEKLLLDGRTRLLACHKAGQEIRCVEYDGVLDPWEFVAANNLSRRHLTTGQIAIFGDGWREHEEKLAKEREHKGRPKKGVVTLSHDNGKTRDKIGEKIGVSGSSVDKAKLIRDESPDILEKVSDGSMTLEAGYKETRKRIAERANNPQDVATPVAAEVTAVVTPDGKRKKINLPAKVMFNATNDSVDWAKWTWNPVTGCEHGCRFCYAREIALSQRMSPYYPNGFEPTFHEYRLDAPKNTKRPTDNDARSGRVFVCSMADLFGKWVPKEWIEKVFSACLESPEWEYLFLTKWPARYMQMPLIKRAWYGASVIQQADVSRVEKAMQKIEDPDVVCWISLEPMLGPIKFDDLSWCDLVVIGSQTSTNQPDGLVPAFAPEFDWIVDVVNQCRDAGVPYYLKANLGTESPGMKLPKSNPRRA